jgi:thiamine-phosphate pyrophosphorylase
MIVISNPVSIEREIYLIQALFEEGLDIFHVRKPDYSANEMSVFLSKIKVEYSMRLVLHSHYQLADEFGINKIHFTEMIRKNTSIEELNDWKKRGFELSTSTHNIDDFNNLDKVFGYAFLGPVFQSISKVNYYPNCDFFSAIKKRTNFVTRLVAIGGITFNNRLEAKTMGFDDVALLGAIWNNM